MKLLNISLTNLSTISAGSSHITQDSSSHTASKILRFPVTRYCFFSLPYPRPNSIVWQTTWIFVINVFLRLEQDIAFPEQLCDEHHNSKCLMLSVTSEAGRDPAYNQQLEVSNSYPDYNGVSKKQILRLFQTRVYVCLCNSSVRREYFRTHFT